MSIKRRKKTTRMQGTRTHGWGLVHRNSGQRGGAGNASRGKKAHAKKPSNWLDKDNPKYFGKHGFVHKGPKIEDITINIKELDEKIQNWVQENKATKKENNYEINLESLGYTKLLSTGQTTKKLTITIKNATEKSINKITKAGGKVNNTAKQK